MTISLQFLVLLLFTAANAATIAQRKAPSKVVEKRASTCTPTAGGSSSTDDVPAIESAIASCGSGGTIVIPSGKTYYINSVLEFTGCSDCTIQIDGTLEASDDTTYWNGKTAIMYMDGITNAKVYSSTGDGTINGNGQASWDLFATDSSYARPTLFYITDSSGITVENMYFDAAPNVFHSVTGGSSNVVYKDITLYAVSSSSNAAKNTDGWDIGKSTYVTIETATVTNDDDCVAFKPGANYVSVSDISCTGSHGLSVGSLGGTAGQTDTVENVIVNGATMIDSTKASGIKLYPGGSDYGTAVVSNVTFESVVVDSSDYAVQIQSCYNSETSYCDDYPSTATLTDVVFTGFSGKTSTTYEPVVANLDCPADGTCGVTLSDMTVEPPSGSAEYLCANTPSDIGITCTSGASG